MEGLRRLRRVLRGAEIGGHPPLDLEKLASHLSVSEIRLTPLAMRGRIAVEGPRVSIEINAEDPPFVQRFTLAHEIAHLVVEDGRVRAAVRQGRAVESLDRRYYEEVERVCDLLAGELLLPEEWLKDHLDLHTPSLSTAQSIAVVARVPLTFVVKRAIERGLWRASASGWTMHRGHARVAWSVIEHGGVLGADDALTLVDERLIVDALAADEVVHESLTLKLHDQDEIVEAQACRSMDDEVILLIPTE